MSMTVYQIRVEGPKAAFDGKGHFYSRKVFVDKADAEVYVPEFSKICCGGGLFDLYEVTKVTIVEIELIGDITASQK